MADKTGDVRIDDLVDKNAEAVHRLEHLSEEKAAENDELIESIHKSRSKRLGRNKRARPVMSGSRYETEQDWLAQ